VLDGFGYSENDQILEASDYIIVFKVIRDIKKTE
jgi:hypothetical protein